MKKHSSSKMLSVLMSASLLPATALFTAPLSTTAFAADKGLSITPGYGYFNFDKDLGYADQNAPSIGVEYHFGNQWSLGANYVKSETEVENTASPLDFTYTRLDAYYNFSTLANFATPYLSVGAGENEQQFSSGLEIDETLLNFGGGMRFSLAEGLSVIADLRGVNSIDEEKTSSLASVGLSYLFGGSGFASGSDEANDPFEISEAKPVDSDADGIADVDDQCADTPQGVATDDQGCGFDGDYDGIADYLDKCAETPRNAPIDEDGCPSDLDSDGVADYQDKCNDTIDGRIVDATGCALTLTKNIQFQPNSATIASDLRLEMQELATFLQRYESTTAVIEGHADTSGSPAQNTKLSAARAAEVKKILVEEFGIDESRLKTVSYGESRPIASNSTKNGRNINRRVTTTIIQE